MTAPKGNWKFCSLEILIVLCGTSQDMFFMPPSWRVLKNYHFESSNWGLIFMGYTQKHDAKISQSDPINNKTQ